MKKIYIVFIFLSIFFINSLSISHLITPTNDDTRREIKHRAFLSDFVSNQYYIATERNMSNERLNEIIDAIFKAADYFDVSPLLIAAIIDTETTFRNVIGGLGEVGYMQLKPTTAIYMLELYSKDFENLGYGKSSFFNIETRLLTDPTFNILIGTAYLRHLLNNHNNDIFTAIGWYNGGGNTVYAARVVNKISKIMIYYPNL